MPTTNNEDNSIIKINNTSYSVYGDWLKLAEKYFNLEKENKNSINLLKAGFFGYFNEIASNEIKNSVYYKNFIYDEHFLNTATAPESIYNFAKLYNVEIINATPSHLTGIIYFNKEDLLNSSLLKKLTTIAYSNDNITDMNNITKTYQATISKNYNFTIEDYNFLLPYDVQIIVKERINSSGTSTYSINALYDINDTNFPFMEVNNPYLRIWEDKRDGLDYIYIVVDLYQLERNTDNFIINSEDLSESLFFRTEYTDQIAFFNVYYNYNGETTLLNKYFNNSYNPSDEEYCYYSFIDNKIEISFSALTDSFRPRYNSELIVEYFTTKGSEGNFEYKGNIDFNFSNDEEESFEKFNLGVVTLTNPTNGKDNLSLDEIKTLIVEKATTRDNLITDNDLNIYFSNINKNNNINNGNILFIKGQDDIIKRLYNCFVLLRDASNKIIPTNTINNTSFKLTNLISSSYIHNDEGYFIIPENSLFLLEYDENSNSYNNKLLSSNDINEFNNKLNTNENPFSYTATNNIEQEYLYYTNPFLIKCNTTNNIYYTDFYNLYINKDFTINYNFINNLVNNSFVINGFNIKKEGKLNFNSSSGNYYYNYNDDTYSISFNLNINNNLDDISKIQVIGLLSSRKDKTEYGYVYFGRDETYNNILDNNSNLYTYKALLSTKKEFDGDKLKLYNSLYDKYGKIIENVTIDEDIDIEIGLLFGTPLDNNNNNSVITALTDDENEFIKSSISTYSNDSIYDKFILKADNLSFPVITKESNDINYITFSKNSYILINTFKNNEVINLYKNISNIVTTNLSYNSSSQEYTISMLPLIGLKYYLRRYDELYDILNKYIEILKDTTNKIQNNTDLSLKFYNTFGPSKWFSIINEYYSNTEYQYKTEKHLLNRTDITINMEIFLNGNIDNSLRNTIIEFISSFIENSNDEDDNIIAVSNLIRLLENIFSEIKYIKFNGLSDFYDTKLVNGQIIENSFTSIEDLAKKQEIIDYVPEYINLRKTITDRFVTNGNNIILTGSNYDYVIQLKMIYN